MAHMSYIDGGQSRRVAVAVWWRGTLTETGGERAPHRIPDIHTHLHETPLPFLPLPLSTPLLPASSDPVRATSSLLLVIPQRCHDYERAERTACTIVESTEPYCGNSDESCSTTESSRALVSSASAMRSRSASSDGVGW